jgi:small subunit ribosomal protein S1
VLLGGIPEQPLEKTFFAYPLSVEKWDEFITQQKEGDSVEVQILFWREKAMCYLVVTNSGIVGMLPSTEINWLSQSREELKQLLKPGDIFKAMILRISKEKNRVVFSKKALDKNPIDDELTKIHLNDLFVGTVVNVLDYGCFIQLEPSGIQALLHRTKIPEGKTFSKGDSCNFYIDSVDFEKKRIGVKLTIS